MNNYRLEREVYVACDEVRANINNLIQELEEGEKRIEELQDEIRNLQEHIEGLEEKLENFPNYRQTTYCLPSLIHKPQGGA